MGGDTVVGEQGIKNGLWNDPDRLGYAGQKVQEAITEGGVQTKCGQFVSKFVTVLKTKL